MKVFANLISTIFVTVAFCACSGGQGNTGQNADSPFGTHRNSDPGVIYDFSASYKTPPELAELIGQKSVFNYVIHKAGRCWNGDYTIYRCETMTCVDRERVLSVRCSKKSCHLLDENSKPIRNGRRIVLLNKGGTEDLPDITITIADPGLRSSGLQPELLAAGFETKMGKKSALLPFYFKN